MASDRPATPPVVVLDANLLYPFQLRNLLVQFGVDGIIAPRWTARINEEWISNLVAAGRAPRDRLLGTLGLMNRALPEAEVSGWEVRMEGLALPDPELMRASTEAAHANLSRSAPSLSKFLDALERQGLPMLARRLRQPYLA